MKRASRRVRDSVDDLRSEYTCDCSKAKQDPHAGRLQAWTVAVVLEPDVAATFPDGKAVNRQLRAVVATVPRRSRKRIAPRTRGGRSRSRS
jgi:hypothetical protein